MPAGVIHEIRGISVPILHSLFSFAQQALDTWPRCSSRRRSKASIRRPRPASSWERIGQRGWAACRSLPLSPRQQANTSRGPGSTYEHLSDGDHMQVAATCGGVAFGGLETHRSPRSLQSPCRWWHLVLPPRVCVAVPGNEATRFSFRLVQNITPSSSRARRWGNGSVGYCLEITTVAGVVNGGSLSCLKREKDLART